MTGANEFLRDRYIAEFNDKFAVSPAQKGTAFVRTTRKDLDWIFSVQLERTVDHDNTVRVDNRVFQIAKTRWRNTLTGQNVMVHEHLDGRVSIRYGAHVIAEIAAGELPPQAPRRKGKARPPGPRSSTGTPAPAARGKNLCRRAPNDALRSPAANRRSSGDTAGWGKNRKDSFFGYGGSASKPPGFNAFGQN
jgi:hypothetical protein